MSNISDLGNGSGLIYVTDSSDNILSAVPNTKFQLISIYKNAVGWRFDPVTNNDGDNTNYGYYLDSDASAPLNSLSGAINITQSIVSRSLIDEFAIDGASISSGELEVERKANLQFVNVGGEGSSNDDLTSIVASDNSAFSNGDVLILLFANSGDITVKDAASPSDDELELDGDFTLDDATKSIMVRYNGTHWVELMRNPASTSVDAQDLRNNDVSVNGNSFNSLTVTNGGSDEIDPNTDSHYVEITGTTGLTSDYEVTVSEANAGDWYIVKIAADYVLVGGDINLFGTDITGTIVPSNTSSSNPAWVHCYYDGTSWDYYCTVDIDRYELDIGVQPEYAKMIYDFSVDGGAVSTITPNSGNNAIPQGSLVLLKDALIYTETALTSGGSATVALGINTDDDALDDFRNFDATVYSSDDNTDFVNPTVSTGVMYVSSAADITITISTAALTAGKVVVLVPYVRL